MKDHVKSCLNSTLKGNNESAKSVHRICKKCHKHVKGKRMALQTVGEEEEETVVIKVEC